MGVFDSVFSGLGDVLGGAIGVATEVATASAALGKAAGGKTTAGNAVVPQALTTTGVNGASSPIPGNTQALLMIAGLALVVYFVSRR